MGRTAISQHDSPLGRWTRAFYFPDPPLADHVQLFWHVRGCANYLRDRRLPTGNAHLLFNLGAAPTLFARESGGPSRSFPTCWLAGQSESFIETGSHGETVLLGAQFHGHGAYRLLRLAQHELSGQVIELEALLGDHVLGLRQRLLETPSPLARFVLLEQWLLRLLDRGAQVHPAVVEASRAIAGTHGQIALPALSRHTGFSREHLIRRFREQVGLTPKAYGNIVRFNRALELARAPAPSWAEIAQACGYYDQSHLVRDFQRFAGRAPATLLRDARPDAASIVIE
jgi:AraC-like DNA-binding protein